MTFAEVELACKGYETRMARLKEVPRLIATILLNINRKAGSKVLNVEEVFPLYTDKQQTKEKLITKEEFEKAKEFSEKAWQATNLKQD